MAPDLAGIFALFSLSCKTEAMFGRLHLGVVGGTLRQFVMGSHNSFFDFTGLGDARLNEDIEALHQVFGDPAENTRAG